MIPFVLHTFFSMCFLYERTCAMRKNTNRWIILLAGFILMLCAGLVFAWSVFVEPIENDLGFSRSQTSIVFTITLSISILGQICAGMIVTKKSAKIPFLIAAVLLAVGFFFASRLQTLIELYIFFGVFCGFAIGIIYNAVMATVIKSFPDKPGLASGVILMGFGLGGLVLGSLSVNLMLHFGWRMTFLLFAFLFGGLAFAGSLIIKEPYNYNKDVSASQSQTADVPPLKMIKTKAFIMFFIWATLTTGSTILVIGHAAPCASDIGATVQIAALASGVISTFNGLSRLFFGKMYDNRGHRFSMSVLFIILMTATATIAFAYSIQSVPALFVGYALIGISYGGGPPILNSYIKEKFGLKYYGVNLGIMNLQMAFSSLLGPLIAGVIKTNYGTYLPAFYIMFAFAVISFIVSFGTGKSSVKLEKAS